MATVSCEQTKRMSVSVNVCVSFLKMADICVCLARFLALPLPLPPQRATESTNK